MNKWTASAASRPLAPPSRASSSSWCWSAGRPCNSSCCPFPLPPLPPPLSPGQLSRTGTSPSACPGACRRRARWSWKASCTPPFYPLDLEERKRTSQVNHRHTNFNCTWLPMTKTQLNTHLRQPAQVQTEQQSVDEKWCKTIWLWYHCWHQARRRGFFLKKTFDAVLIFEVYLCIYVSLSLFIHTHTQIY